MEEPEPTIDYQALVLEALREVPRRALAHVAEHGMPGESHFFVSFRTRHPQVEIPRFLRDQYPDEVTIILQHQFWSLEIEPDAFSVFLSFGGRRHPLRVPFAALTAFADPSADFVLRFEAAEAAPSGSERGEAAPAPRGAAPVEASAPSEASGSDESAPGDVLRFDPSRRK